MLIIPRKVYLSAKGRYIFNKEGGLGYFSSFFLKNFEALPFFLPSKKVTPLLKQNKNR